MYFLGIMHGIFSGTDTSMSWAQNYYWISAGSLLFLFFARVVGAVIDALFPIKKQISTSRPS
jgi:Mg/Co/Ni transporter MgtE